MSEFLQKVLFATDGSHDSSLAANVAMDVALKSGAELHLVHAWQNVRSPHLQAYMKAELEQWGREILDKQVEEIESGGVNVAQTHLLMGRSADVILAVAEEIGADLLVMGSRGVGRVERLILGSVAEGVAHQARCPTLIVRGEQWPPQRLVVGDDGSEASREAERFAHGFAGMFDAGEVLVRSYQEPPTPIGGWSHEAAGKLDGAKLEEERGLSRRARDLGADRGAEPGIEFSAEEPAVAILNAAGPDEGSLVAVGSRGLGAVRRAMLGSVSTKVLRAARGPVLVCPGPWERADDKSERRSVVSNAG